MLHGRMFPCGSREAVVTVTSYAAGVMDGWLQHPRLEKKERFQSLSQMILLLNALLDLENCPDSPLPLVLQDDDMERGIAGFRIQVLFREHYTWQGRLVWKNENKEFVFRSVLELQQLLDEILAK